jgi:hypothetical protein
MPIKGMGKFEGETYIVKWVYSTSDGGIGESDSIGWYDYYSGKIKGRGPFHVIVTENSVGFVSGRFFDSESAMMKVWREIEDEVEAYYEESGED